MAQLPRAEERLPLELRAKLDAEPVGALAEYLCDRLGLSSGEVSLRLNFSVGRLRNAAVGTSGISPAAFEALGAREARRGGLQPGREER